MKALKILALFFVLLFSTTQASFAQSKGKNLSTEQKEELAANMEAYFTDLNLSEAQKTEFKEISEKYASQMKAVKESDAHKFQKFKKVKSIRKNKNAEMKKLLSDDQYKVYLEKQEEMQEKMKESYKKNI